MEKRILLVRTDRIGDLISVTPAIEVLRKNFPKAYIAVLVSRYASAVLKDTPGVDEIIIKKGFFETLREVRAKKFDTAVVFFLDFYAGLLTFLARIPVRVGPVSKIWALFLNRRIKQNRSSVERHEVDFNLDLLKPLFVFFYPAVPKIYVPKKQENKAKKYLREKLGILPSEPFIIVHPGSKGSAKNWPAAHYALFLQNAARKFPKYKFLLTGGPEEKKLIKNMAVAAGPRVSVLKENIPLEDFIAVINECKLFVSNSTGPLHIAVALGKKTLSFYPMLKGCMPFRWGPYGAGHEVLQPDIKICQKCKPKCGVECMSLISPSDALAALERQIASLKN